MCCMILCPPHSTSPLEQVENLDLLTDSNKLMREERDRQQESIKTLETSLERLEREVGPLREANRQLSAQKDALLTEKTALRYLCTLLLAGMLLQCCVVCCYVVLVTVLFLTCCLLLQCYTVVVFQD